MTSFSSTFGLLRSHRSCRAGKSRSSERSFRFLAKTAGSLVRIALSQVVHSRSRLVGLEALSPRTSLHDSKLEIDWIYSG